MKKIYAPLIILFVVSGCLEDIENAILPTEQISLIEFHYVTPAVSPEYQYSYDVLINSDGSSVYSFRKGDDRIMETFNITEQEFEELNKMIKDAGLLKEKVNTISSDEIPDGASRQWLVLLVENLDPDLDQPPRRIEMPVYPEEKYKESLSNIYSKIKNLIPENLKHEN